MSDIGIKVRKLKELKLHAKMLLADGERAIIGSINLAPGSFDSRRELAIEVDDKHIVDRLQEVVHRDWKKARPLDLTDEGLFADLEKHGGKGLEELGLEEGERQTPALPGLDLGKRSRPKHQVGNIAHDRFRAVFGRARQLFPCGSLLNASHFASMSDRSGKLTI